MEMIIFEGDLASYLTWARCYAYMHCDQVSGKDFGQTNYNNNFSSIIWQEIVCLITY